MTADEQLIAALDVLVVHATTAAEDARAGRLDQAKRDELATVLAELVRDLRRVDTPNDSGDSGGR